MWRIHRHIGMGGDQLVARSGRRARWTRSSGDDIRDAEADALHGADRGCRAVARRRELIQDAAGARRTRSCWPARRSSTRSTTTSTCSRRATLADGWTTSGDVETHEAGARPGRGRAREGRRRRDAVMVGDSTWTARPPKRAGDRRRSPSLTGGFSEQELRRRARARSSTRSRRCGGSIDETPLADSPPRSGLARASSSACGGWPGSAVHAPRTGRQRDSPAAGSTSAGRHRVCRRRAPSVARSARVPRLGDAGRAGCGPVEPWTPPRARVAPDVDEKLDPVAANHDAGSRARGSNARS